MGFIAGVIDPAAPALPQLPQVAAGLVADRRLLVDLTVSEGPLALAAGERPLQGPDGRHLLAFHGHLDNAEELRHAYALEFPFSAGTDAEVVLAALALDGQRSLSRLSGAYALCFWDRERKQGFAARDRLGVKSLFWTREESALRLSSSPAGLRRPAPDLEALAGWVLAPALSRMGLHGVQVLPPGGLLELGGGGDAVRRWWTLRPPERSADDEAVLDDVMRRVYVGTSGSVASAGEVGVLLSGGFVSALLTTVGSFMHDELQAFTLEASPGDVADAEAVCAEAEVELQRLRFAGDALPPAPPTALPLTERDLGQQALLAAVAPQVERVIVGDGAAILHFGHPLFMQPGGCASPMGLLEAFGAPSRLQLLHPALAREPWLQRLAAQIDARLQGTGQGFGGTEESARAVRALLVEGELGQQLHVREALARANGVQVRVPFGSTELLELAARVRPSLALRGGAGMWDLRAGLRGEIPEAVRWKAAAGETAWLGDDALRAQVQGVLDAPPALLEALLDLPALHAASRRASLLAADRAGLRAALSLSRWAAAHGIS